VTTSTHPLAGRLVRVVPLDGCSRLLRGVPVRVEGTAREVGVQPGSPASIAFAARMAMAGRYGWGEDAAAALYGHVAQGSSIGVLIHPDEVGGIVDEP
jgi:hypothetical protein